VAWPDGTLVSGATVELYDPDYPPYLLPVDLENSTQSDGRFVLSGLSDERYIVTARVVRDGKTIHAHIVEVPLQETKAIQLILTAEGFASECEVCRRLREAAK
jgi:hypothetical protein